MKFKSIIKEIYFKCFKSRAVIDRLSKEPQHQLRKIITDLTKL